MVNHKVLVVPYELVLRGPVDTESLVLDQYQVRKLIGDYHTPSQSVRPSLDHLGDLGASPQTLNVHFLLVVLHHVTGKLRNVKEQPLV